MPRHTKSRTTRAQRWLILLMFGALLIAPWPGPAAPAPAVRAQTGTTQAANQDYNGPAGPPYVLPGWGDVPWAAPQYYTTIQLGDLDGDGKDELIGRDVGGIAVHKFDSALGQWLPVLAADGTILRGPLSDTDGWDFPQYYLTIQLADVDGKPGKELVARGAGGINVLQFTNETKPGGQFPMGKWQTITDGGPFTDDDGWKNGTTYPTIQLADIDGQPGEELVGRAASDGLRVYKWNGKAWNKLTGVPELDDNHNFNSESQYKTIQFADIDGQPGGELLFRESDGLHVCKYQPGANGGSWVRTIDGNQPFSNGEGFGDPDKYWTIQTADIDGEAGDEVLGRGGNGMVVLKYASSSPTAGSWSTVADQGPFTDAEGGGWWKRPQLYKTIQFADINGDKKAELLVRGEIGMHAYQWNAGAKSWTEISSARGVPALADNPWAKGEWYYTTIQTGNVDGDAQGQAELIARGTTGIRTWFWRNDTWFRDPFYDHFPAFSGDNLTAYEYLLTYTGVNVPKFRDIYTDPATDPDVNTLNQYQTKIAGTCDLPALPGTVPQYKSCHPPAGSGLTQLAWTTVANQIIAELFWVQQVYVHFDGLENIRTQLFLTQNSSFPSIATDLQLSQAADKTTAANYVSLIINYLGNLLKFTGSLIGPEGAALTISGNAMATAMSAGSLFSAGGDPFSGNFEHKYADMQKQIATIQQQTQTAIIAQKRYVKGDYGLLITVGNLVGSSTWQLDELGTLSAGRYGFTTWVYQSFLPLLWDRFVITNCNDSAPGIGCGPPASGPYMQTKDGGVNFTAILNKDSFLNPACGVDPYGGHECNYNTPPDPTLFGVVNTPLSPQCKYQPGITNGWQYGCSLGASTEIFNNTGGWNFRTRYGNPVVSVSLTLGDGSCNAICFRSPEYFLGRLNQLPRGTVLVAGSGLNNAIDTDHQSKLRLALDGGNSAQDRFNRYFVAAQLGLLAAPGTNQGALASRLECYRMDFNPIRLSNGSILSPSATLGTLLEQARQAARGGNPADLEALSRLLQVLTGDDPAGRCSAGGRLP